MTPSEEQSAKLTADAVTHEIVRLRERVRRLREVVAACGRQFGDYELQHMAKSPPDRAKAVPNAEFRLMCKRALEDDDVGS